MKTAVIFMWLITIILSVFMIVGGVQVIENDIYLFGILLIALGFLTFISQTTLCIYIIKKEINYERGNTDE